MEITDAVRQALGALQRRLAGQTQAVRWTKPEHIHLTLKFLGETPESRLPELTQAVQQIATGSRPWEFAVRQIGCFPPRGPVRIIWVGIEEPSGALADCQSACEVAFADLGFARESRAHHPHLTVGRVKEGKDRGQLRELVEKNRDFQAGTVLAESLTLFESRLSPRGPSYFVVSRSVLGGEQTRRAH